MRGTLKFLAIVVFVAMASAQQPPAWQDDLG